MSTDTPAALAVLSFGYLHGAPPEATLTVDLRRALRDPHTDPALRQLTGAHEPVQAKVMATRGARRLLAALHETAAALAHATAPGQPVTIALGCAGGRHRSYVLAERLASALRADGRPVTVTHLHAHLPVAERAGTPKESTR